MTGLTMVDTLAVTALLQAADAARLFEAQAALAGVSPAAAQTIVSLGLEPGMYCEVVRCQTLPFQRQTAR